MSEPQLRVGDAERAHAVQQLQSQAAAGRLTQAELADRTRQAEGARYREDLAGLFSDLPGGMAPLPESTWATPTGVPSRVTDGPSRPATAHAEPEPYTDRFERRAARREDRYAERAERRGNPWTLLVTLGYAIAGIAFITGAPWQVGVVILLVTSCILGPVVYTLTKRR